MGRECLLQKNLIKEQHAELIPQFVDYILFKTDNVEWVSKMFKNFLDKLSENIRIK